MANIPIWFRSKQEIGKVCIKELRLTDKVGNITNYVVKGFEDTSGYISSYEILDKECSINVELYLKFEKIIDITSNDLLTQVENMQEGKTYILSNNKLTKDEVNAIEKTPLPLEIEMDNEPDVSVKKDASKNIVKTSDQNSIILNISILVIGASIFVISIRKRKV